MSEHRDWLGTINFEGGREKPLMKLDKVNLNLQKVSAALWLLLLLKLHCIHWLLALGGAVSS